MYQTGKYREFWKLVQTLRSKVAGSLLVSLATACAAPERAAEAGDVKASKSKGAEDDLVSNTALPVNQRFRSLDEYLLYLQNVEGPSDGVWFRMIEPGLYQMETGNARRLTVDGEPKASAEKTVFTRDELTQKFGFSE